MSVFVFVGPTLERSEASRHLDATFLPPVSHGDFIRVAVQKPKAIGIIDGYFDHTLSVWHKEILWALAERIPVFGAASIGALRAVELAPFGMVGVGKIFRAFHLGELEDDDEVAVAHLSEERGFEPISEALVNVRATVQRAHTEGVATTALGEQIVSVAKALHYAERSWERILGSCIEAGVAVGSIETLRRWLPSGRVDQKRSDAIALLSVMQRLVDERWTPDAPDFRFQNTNAWQAALVRLSGTLRPAEPSSPKRRGG